MAPDNRGTAGPLRNPRNTCESKWNVLFEKETKEWIAFKPALGLHVYPCYSCRHMFYSKKSFLDHINRRAIVLQYKCPKCSNEEMTFYNRCSLLLHCRKHYSLDNGSINLSNLQVTTLPLGLAGFFKHSDIPYLFEVEEDLIEPNCYMNAQFYSPKIEDKGKETILLTPSRLLITRSSENGENVSLALKQIAKNIPKCKFVTVEEALKEQQLEALATNNLPAEVKREPQESHNEQITFSEQPQAELPQANGPPQSVFVNDSAAEKSISSSIEDMILPVITKVETVEEPLGSDSTSPPLKKNASRPGVHNKCPECKSHISETFSNHFLGGNRPMNEKLRCSNCKLISPTICSFKAHLRIHAKIQPYVCPDCGSQFKERELLVNHMDEVCFHLAKSVRFRCPGKRCGKIFASDATFGPHFRQVHIDTLYMCGICKEVYSQLEDCEDHCLMHDEEGGNIVKMFSCYTCGEQDMNWHKLKKHLEFHCNDLSRCIYIYMCKFCKCYFRSVQTMATHLLNCKVQKTGVPRRVRTSTSATFVQSKYISGQCKVCGNKIICLKAKPLPYCSKCLVNPVLPPLTARAVKKPPMTLSDKCVCILCKMQIDFDERRRHQKACKYAKPQVLVERLDLEKMMEARDQSFSSSNSDLDGSHDGSLQKNREDSSDENRPRKRHKPSKPKKPEMESDLIAEEPIPFDGTYQCRLCEYKNTERKLFHEHVMVHRNISTAYQCMECGECFVVKPSLVKHLMHFHNIADSEEYFSENNCFDKGAINELAKVVKAPYLANNVKENQCKVCMQQFDDAEAHDKHFRIHGMAFLMKNTI